MPKRKRLRLFGFDYGLAWWYFVTSCAARRGNRFGVVQGERVRLNRRGTIVARQLGGLPLRLEGVQLDTWIVMPDHVHAVLVLEGGVTLGQAVAAFKAGASRMRVNPCGSGDIGTGSSATRTTWRPSAITSAPIPRAGPRPGWIRPTTRRGEIHLALGPTGT